MGFLAYDKRTGEIIYSIPTPQGRIGPYNWDYIFQGNPDYPEHIGTMDDGPELTTRRARESFKVVDGKLVSKNAT